MIRKNKRIAAYTVALLIAFFSSQQSFAQNTERWGISFNAVGGYVWAHSGKVDNLAAQIYGYRLGVRFKTANKKQWHREYNQPYWGVDYLYQNYGKPNILGSLHAILPYVDFPIAHYKKVGVYIKASSGIGYITKPFNLETNRSNWTIGSHININMGLQGLLVVPINNTHELLASGGLIHFSNGNFKKPNLGINTPVVSVGFTHYIGKKIVEKEQPNNFDSSKHQYSLTISIARKNADYIYPKIINVPIVQFKYLYTLTTKNRLGGGIDFFYDKEYFYKNNRNKPISEAPFAESAELGAKISHELKGKNIALITDLGFYLFNKNELKGNFYQRIGFDFSITNAVGFSLALKTHLKSADYFEFGLNYRIRKN